MFGSIAGRIKMSKRKIVNVPHPTTFSLEKAYWGDAADSNRFNLQGLEVLSWNSKSTSDLIFSQSPIWDLPEKIGNEVVFQNPVVNQSLSAGSQYLFADETHTGLSLFFLARSTQDGQSVFVPFSGVKWIFDFGNYNTKGFGIIYAKNQLAAYTPLSYGGALTEKFPLDNSTEDYVVISFVIKFGDSQKLYLNGDLVAQSAISLTQLTANEINESAIPTTGGGPVTIGSGAKSNLGSNRWFKGGIKNWLAAIEAVDDIKRKWIEQYLHSQKFL